MKISDNGFPRRNRIDLLTPAEKAIWDARMAVERGGAHPLLTDAVNLLGAAQEKVADFVERDEPPSGPCLICAHVHPFSVSSATHPKIGVCERCFFLAKGNQGSCTKERGCLCADPTPPWAKALHKPAHCSGCGGRLPQHIAGCEHDVPAGIENSNVKPEIIACERETGHAIVPGTGFCRCTHAMYDDDPELEAGEGPSIPKPECPWDTQGECPYCRGEECAICGPSISPECPHSESERHPGEFGEFRGVQHPTEGGAAPGASADPRDWPGGVPTDPRPYFKAHPLTEGEIAYGQSLEAGDPRGAPLAVGMPPIIIEKHRIGLNGAETVSFYACGPTRANRDEALADARSFAGRGPAGGDARRRCYGHTELISRSNDEDTAKGHQ